MRKQLKNLHRIIGIIGVIYMFVMAVTGTILVYKNEIISTMVPAVSGSVAILAPTQQAEILSALETRYSPEAIRTIRLPVEGMNAYRLYLTGKRTFLLDTETLQPVDDPLGIDAILQFIFDLHHYLALGDVGKQIVGVLGIAAVLSILSGVYLWWPWRKGFRLSTLRAKGGKAAALRSAHATMGIMVAPLLLLIAITGSAMIYSGPVRTGLAAVFGGERPVVDTVVTNSAKAALFELSNAYLEGAIVTGYNPDSKGSGRIGLRIKLPSEWLPNGRSSVLIEGDKAQVFDATAQGRGLKIADTIYPLHAGKVGGSLYKISVAFVGLGTVFLTLMAGLAYTRKRRTPKARKAIRFAE